MESLKHNSLTALRPRRGDMLAKCRRKTKEEHLCLFRSVDVLKVLADEIGVVDGGVRGEDAEEIGGGGYLSILLDEIILQERKEGGVADAGAEIIEEVRAPEVNRIRIGPEAIAGIDRDIDPALRTEIVDAIRPPPGNQFRIGAFIEEVLAVGGEG